MINGGDVVVFETAAAWEKWLSENRDSVEVIWLCIAKKGTSFRAVTYDDALDVALCYGWIDGHRKSHDDLSFLQRFTPRRPNSMWSQRNVNKAMQLQVEGRIQPSGFAKIEAAKKDGRWHFGPSQGLAQFSVGGNSQCTKTARSQSCCRIAGSLCRSDLA